MAVLAMPVMGSSHTTEEVVSVHDSNSDFNSGSLSDELSSSSGNLVLDLGSDSATFTSQDTWTAPSDGVVTFQLWGPGGGDGGSRFGATGDGGTGGYVEVELDVNEGETYTIHPGTSGGDGSSGASLDGGGGGGGGSGLYSGGSGGSGGNAGSGGGGGGGGGGGDSGVTDPGGNEVASAGGGGGGGGASDDDYGGGGGGGGAQGGSGGDGGDGGGSSGDSGSGPGTHGGNGGNGADRQGLSSPDGPTDGADGGYNVEQGTLINGVTGGGNDGNGQVSLSFESTADQQYTSATHDVTDPLQGFTDITSINDVSATVTWQYHDGSSWQDIDESTYTSTGNHSVDISGQNSEAYRVVIDVSTTGDDPEFTLNAEGVTAENHLPELSDPDPTGNEFINEAPIELSVNVTDEDFDTAQGDTVTVEFFDGDDTLLDTDTLTSNGTATGTFDNPVGGENHWYATATDSHGATDRSPVSGNHTFETVGELEIRDENDPSELIDTDEINVTVRFFEQDGSIDDRIFEREATGGTADMAGLPVDEELLVQTSAEGWHDRSILIDSLMEQSQIFLLNEEDLAIANTFILNDHSGQYQLESTVLDIQGPIDIDEDGEAEWMTVSADYFGGVNRVPVMLSDGERYRLVIRSDAGDTRILGDYVAQDPGDVTLEIGTITFPADASEEQWYYTTHVDAEDREFFFAFEDPDGITEDLSLTVYDRENESNVLIDVEESGPFGEFVYQESISAAEADTTWVVEWEATRNGETIGSTTVAGAYRLDLPVGEGWLHTGILLFLTFFAALSSGRIVPIGALALVGFAGLMLMFGWVNIPVPMFIVAALIAIYSYARSHSHWR